MFIREVISTKGGKKYIQHKLIESIRTPLGPRQRVVLSMGKIDIPQEQWKTLANAIEAEYTQQPGLFPDDKNQEITSLAKHYATLIIQNELNKQQETISSRNTREDNTEENEKKKQNNIPDNSQSAEYETVDINSLEHSNGKTIGAEQIIASQIQQYEFGSFLKKIGFSPEQIKRAQALIIARAVHPASERETARWLNDTSGTTELLQIENKISDTSLHRIAGLLLDQKENIEEYLAQQAREHFGLKEKIILYDLTNTFFSSNKRKSTIAKRGRSKEKRNDRPLITLALQVDQQGFPKGSTMFPGNISEPSTLLNILTQLKQQDPLLSQEKTIVIDAGIASEENLKLIQGYGFHYVAVSRKRSFPEDFWKNSEEVNIPIPSDKKNPLIVKLSKTETESFLLCKSTAKEGKEGEILDKRQQKFEEALQSLHAGLQKPRSLKEYCRVLEKIGVLKERYKVGNLYTINVSKETKLDIKKRKLETIHATKIEWKKNDKATLKEEGLGEYVIRTDRLDLAEQEISELHRSLTTIEASFRSMKSELGLRPNYHQSDHHMKAHIFITVLSFHILAAINAKLEENGIYLEWNTIRNILATHIRVTSSFTTKENDVFYIRTTSVPNKEQMKVYSTLGIKNDILGKQKVKFSLFPASKATPAKCSARK